MKLEIWLNDEYANRLWAVKKAEGKHDLPADEFAEELLKRILLREHPAKVQLDESGEIVN